MKTKKIAGLACANGRKPVRGSIEPIPSSEEQNFGEKLREARTVNFNSNDGSNEPSVTR